MKIGYIGLGKMGKNMVLHLLEKDIEVVALNRSPEPLAEVVKAGAIGASDLPDLIAKLPTPRIIWIMLPQGEVVDQFVNQLVPLVNKDDLIIDGGNSNYKDTLRRAKELDGNVHFMDIGTSGGPRGARVGACLMIGGERGDYDRIKHLAEVIAAPGAYQYLGPVGSGHFAKMVHNGIEYGMMQAIAEGAAVLEKSDFNYDLVKVFDLYNHQSVIESRLVGWAEAALRQDPALSQISSVISHTGEGEWTVDAAKELGIAVPVIEKSLGVRKNSASQPENFSNKMVSALRGQFGGHSVGK